MAKKKANNEEVVVDEALAEKDETVSESKPTLKSKKEYPVVNATGKFQAVAFENGFILYNPDGVRVSGIETEQKCKDLVRGMNYGAGLK